jgi:HEAT repeat protein
VTLGEAAAEASALAEAGDERKLADLRKQWEDELEGAARSGDFRERAIAYRAIGQFRWRQKNELLQRGLEDESPACRGSALVSIELLSRDHPGLVNQLRPLLHRLLNSDGNEAVRRLAAVCLAHGSPNRETIVLLEHLGEDDELSRELQAVAKRGAQTLRRKSAARN